MNSEKKILKFLFLSSFIFHLSSFVFPAACAPYHTITVDGDLSDWASDERIVLDFSDGQTTNRIDALYLTWDADNLYIGISYRVDGNGILLYLDRDYGSSAGFDDLTSIDSWDKNAVFSVSGFHPDFQWGSWDGSDGNFYKILTATSTQGISATLKTDFSSDDPCSEISVSWDEIFPDGFVKGAKIAIFASLCDGSSLAVDCAPDNQTAELPAVDTTAVVNCDSNADGIPDNDYISDFEIRKFEFPEVFSPNGDGRNDNLDIAVSLSAPGSASISVFDIEGRKIFSSLLEIPDTGEYSVRWTGKAGGKYASNGIYIVHLLATNSAGEEISENKGVAVVK
ncbi:MAG: gliding motility-associated C-terminal domain-containing protein [Elusimicrobia bacterium]|nr:gliding motility-associated C-terminal domain-containing protein [Elusimicrobiota bacterium]